MQVSQQRATEAEEEQCRAEAEAAAARQELKGFQTSGAGATTASDEENVTVEQLRQVGPLLVGATHWDGCNPWPEWFVVRN